MERENLWLQQKTGNPHWYSKAQVDSVNAFLARLHRENFRVEDVREHNGKLLIGGYQKNKFVVIAYDLSKSAQAEFKEIRPDIGPGGWSAGGKFQIAGDLLLIRDATWKFFVYDATTLEPVSDFPLARTGETFEKLIPAPDNPEILLGHAWTRGADERRSPFDVNTRIDLRLGTRSGKLTDADRKALKAADSSQLYQSDESATDGNFRAAMVGNTNDTRSLVVYSEAEQKATHEIPQSDFVVKGMIPGYISEDTNQKKPFVWKIEPTRLIGNMVIMDYQANGLLTGWQSDGRVQAVYLPDPPKPKTPDLVE